MAWLNNLLGTDFSSAVSLAIIFGSLLIALLIIVWIVRKFMGTRFVGMKKARQPRLSVTDAAIVDDRRRLVLVRRDEIEHLVMIGGPSDIVIETNITRLRPVNVPNTAPAEYRQAEQAAEPAQAASKPEGKTVGATIAGVGAVGTAAVAGLGSATQSAAQTATQGVSATVASVTDSSVATLSAAKENLGQAKDGLADISANALDAVSETLTETTSQATQVASDTIAQAVSTDSPAPAVEPEIASVTEPKSSSVDDDMQALLDELTTENT